MTFGYFSYITEDLNPPKLPPGQNLVYYGRTFSYIILATEEVKFRRMKVVFIKDLKGVGYRNDIKDQPDGYARNFLIPKGFAIPATAEAIKKVERGANEIRVEKEIQSDLFKRNLEAINGAGVTIKVATNDKGHLFKAIHAKDIADALKKDLRIIISVEYIKVPEPIKQTGEFKVGVEALGMKESITVTITKA